MPNNRRPRGARASQVSPGAQGARRTVGPVSAEGPLLTRSARMELLDDVEGQLAEIRHELLAQMKRMTQLQGQVDEVCVTIRELTASATQA